MTYQKHGLAMGRPHPHDLAPSPVKRDIGDVNSGLTLEETKRADLIRSKHGGLLILFGGMQDPSASPSSSNTSNLSSPMGSGNQITSFTQRPRHTNSTWAFDLHTLKWEKIDASGSPPPATAFHSAAATEDGNSMFVFGGETDLGYNTSALHQLKRTVTGLASERVPATELRKPGKIKSKNSSKNKEVKVKDASLSSVDNTNAKKKKRRQRDRGLDLDSCATASIKFKVTHTSKEYVVLFSPC